MYDIFDLPPRLFKYYRYDSSLNLKRLAGEVYLASPLDFNDPCDCRREVVNNAKEKVLEYGEDWLRLKIKELGFNKQDCEIQLRKLLSDSNNVSEIHIRMLEKMGILCLTDKQSDTLMWGYYANNDGLCIEYDKSRIVKNIILGYVNKMSYRTTKLLFEDKKYSQEPSLRNPSTKKRIIDYSKDIIITRDVKHVNNPFLEECDDNLLIINFLRNIFIKRVYAHSIIYNIKPQESPTPLFFLSSDKASETKYFKKTKTWKHENEFRFIVSLGGRTAIDVGTDCIKNVYLGCNISNERIAAIAYIMVKNGLRAGLYKMKRLKNCGLAPFKINWEAHKDSLSALESELCKSE